MKVFEKRSKETGREGIEIGMEVEYHQSTLIYMDKDFIMKLLQ